MPVHIVRTDTCQAPLETAFAYVADYRNVPHWLFGVHGFDPVGEQTYGLGSVFDADVHLGLRLKSRIRVDDWAENRMISFDTVKGFKVQSTWTFEALDATSTAITAEVTYHLPFGPAGKAMGKVIEPAVKQAVSRSADQLRERIEASSRS